jgi:uncharacterized damage-inducible protein DinB
LRDSLINLFKHNTWANLSLIDVCAPLRADQLAGTVDGTYGSVPRTLVHVVAAEDGYLYRMTGERFDPELDEDDFPGFDVLRERALRSGDALESFASALIEDRVINWNRRIDGLPARMPASMFLVQTINHGNEHRSQVATVLTQAGVTPPELDGWGYAIQSGLYQGPLD